MTSWIRVCVVGVSFLVFLLMSAEHKGGVQSPAISSPTPDRLARPTLPPVPSQADYGAQIYWLSCLPCHGDRGQGLTEEFRQTYPPEDRNCWASGCHGKRPYENGFQLPEQVPALIGKGALEKFQNAAALQSYIHAAMPYWKPGSLSEKDAWDVTAYLLKMNGIQIEQELNASTATTIHLGSRDESSPLEATSAQGTNTWIWSLTLGCGTLVGLLIARFLSQSKLRRQ